MCTKIQLFLDFKKRPKKPTDELLIDDLMTSHVTKMLKVVQICFKLNRKRSKCRLKMFLNDKEPSHRFFQ